MAFKDAIQKPGDFNEFFIKEVLSLWCGMCRLAYSLVRNQDDAEDIASEALKRAYVDLLGRTPERLAALKIHPWLSTITRNICWDFLRTQRTRANVASLEVLIKGGDELIFASAADDPEIFALMREFLEIMQKNISPDTLALLYLFYVKGVSVKRLAKQREVNEAVIHARMSRGRKNLRRILQFKGNEELLTRVVREFYRRL